MKVRLIHALGALACMFAVILGAMGAHMLESRFDAHQLSTFETAVRYLFFHGLALLVLPLLPIKPGSMNWISYLFLAGIVLFSGALFLWCFLDASGSSLAKPMGMIAPFGGMSLILGWALTGYSLLKS